jgi:hypothetical protein
MYNDGKYLGDIQESTMLPIDTLEKMANIMGFLLLVGKLLPKLESVCFY